MIVLSSRLGILGRNFTLTCRHRASFTLRRNIYRVTSPVILNTDYVENLRYMSSTSPSRDFIEVAPYKQLLTHFRYFLNLRSQEGRYHSLILFRLSTPQEGLALANGEPNFATPNDISGEIVNQAYNQLYAMESTCPHLGADMSHADIEESETSLVAVCPWHRYDFDLETGHSDTGLRACTYTVEVRTDPTDDVEKVWVEAPTEGRNWRLVECRPVSEEFADPPPAPVDISGLSIEDVETEMEPVVPAENPPTTLMEWAVLILNTPHPTLKVERTRHAVHQFRTGKLKSIGHRSKNAPRPPDIPPRDEAWQRSMVHRSKAGKRKNRVGMLHALANIEQWAIDLAWDIIARFGPDHPDIPPAFFSDFSKMALDESKHFSLLTARLASMGTAYGSLPVHASLWESARITFPSLRSRLAIIHLVHEARGLDVNPATIAKFARSGDEESVKSLEIIHADEVTHVTTGHRWFTWVCAKDGVDPVSTFREEVRKGWTGEIKGPFNEEAREKAGMTKEFYEDLRGELAYANGTRVPEYGKATAKEMAVVVKDETAEPEVEIAYEKI